LMETTIGPDRLKEDIARYSIDGLVPDVVAVPQNVHDVEKAMEAAWHQDLAVAPRGGGTRIHIGNVPERLDVMLDISRLNRVVSHNAGDLTATVEAGITLTSLQKTLAEHGQFLAIDSPLPDRATVGGTLASLASGPMRWQYSHPRDLVIGLKVVQADGTSTKSGGEVVKNVSGYDMARLHIGAFGTLGIITEVSFKLTPLPHRQTTMIGYFDSIESSIAAAMAIFHSHVMPLALTVFDDKANHRGRMTVNRKAILAVRLGGRPKTMERQVNECSVLSKDQGASSVETIDDEDAEVLWQRTTDFGYTDNTVAPIQASASVLPTSVSNTIEAVSHTSVKTRLQPSFIAHPAYGKVHVSWFAENDTLPDDLAIQVLREAREAVHDLGGSLLVERCPLPVKDRIDVWGPIGRSLGLMRKMKRQYDSKRILNSGRFVGDI